MEPKPQIIVPLPDPQVRGEGYVIQPWEKDTVRLEPKEDNG